MLFLFCLPRLSPASSSMPLFGLQASFPPKLTFTLYASIQPVSSLSHHLVCCLINARSFPTFQILIFSYNVVFMSYHSLPLHHVTQSFFLTFISFFQVPSFSNVSFNILLLIQLCLHVATPCNCLMVLLNINHNSIHKDNLCDRRK